MKVCPLCETELKEKLWKVDFRTNVEGPFITVVNYPIMVCSHCGYNHAINELNKVLLQKFTYTLPFTVKKLTVINVEEAIENESFFTQSKTDQAKQLLKDLKGKSSDKDDYYGN